MFCLIRDLLIMQMYVIAPQDKLESLKPIVKDAAKQVRIFPRHHACPIRSTPLKFYQFPCLL